MKEGKYSVMIVEDQQMPKALFSHFVESSEKFYLEVAIENATVADIVCAHTPIDLIIMDVVTENGESGLEAAAIIKKKYPKTKIIIVTSMPECSYIKRAKQRVINGEIVYPDKLQPVKMGLALSTEFTEKELEILRLMTGGYSNREISEKLGISSGVVKNHVADMLDKTGFRSRTQLAVRARESGLVILDKINEDV